VLVAYVSAIRGLSGVLSMAKVENTSKYTVDHLIWTSFGSGFGLGQSQLITILQQTEHRGTLHLSSLSTASLTDEGIPCMIIEISSPSDNLGVPCLYLPLGMVTELKFIEA